MVGQIRAFRHSNIELFLSEQYTVGRQAMANSSRTDHEDFRTAQHLSPNQGYQEDCAVHGLFTVIEAGITTAERVDEVLASVAAFTTEGAQNA